MAYDPFPYPQKNTYLIGNGRTLHERRLLTTLPYPTLPYPTLPYLPA